jgi:hypothetical protein
MPMTGLVLLIIVLYGDTSWKFAPAASAMEALCITCSHTKNKGLVCVMHAAQSLFLKKTVD